jgi:hypothetical protein
MYLLLVRRSREKGRGATWWSTGSYISLVLLERRWKGERGVGIGNGHAPPVPLPQQAGPKIPLTPNARKKVAISYYCIM